MIFRLPHSKTPLIDAGRNGAAIILFVIWPAAQTFIPRSMPFFLGLAVTFILVLKLLGRLRGEMQFVTQPPVAFQLKHPLTIAIGLFLSVVALSLLWSPMPDRGAKDFAVVVAAFLVTAFLARELPKVTLLSLANFVLIGIVIAAFALVLEGWNLTSFHNALLDSNYLLDLNRNAAWLVLAACAALGFARELHVSKAVAWTIGVLVAFAVFSSEGEAAKLALLVAGSAALIARFAPNLLKPLFIILTVVVVTMPTLVNSLTDEDGKQRIVLPAGAHAGHRIAIWQGYAALAQNKPVLGWGAKADRSLGMSGKAARIAASRGYPKKTTSPHNAALEIRINQGLVGAVLFALVILTAGWTVSNLQRWPRISATALISAVFTVSMTGSSFYQSWWIASIATGFAIWGSTLRVKE